MSSLRLWLVILAAICFLAGFSGGVLAGPLFEEPATPRPFAAYEEHLIANFDLSGEERQHLRFLLDRYHQDIESLKAQYVDELEPELIELGLSCRDLIRKYVLPPERVEEFDRLAGGNPPTP